jgi:tRNA(Ile)-lysidine synthase TilS/MesJ
MMGKSGYFEHAECILAYCAAQMLQRTAAPSLRRRFKQQGLDCRKGEDVILTVLASQVRFGHAPQRSTEAALAASRGSGEREMFMAVKRNLAYAQKNCLAKCGKLMQQTDMAGPDSRIGVAVSGGADSLVMLKLLTLRQAIVPFSFEVMALHVNPGFDDDAHQPALELCRELGVPLHSETGDFGPRAHSSENRKASPCFFCSRRRRKVLFELCERYKLTHLALGHHGDDAVSTFLMNLVQNGRVESLPAAEPFFDGRLMVIRPLLLLKKAAIMKAARQWALPVRENPCPSSGATTRDQTHVWLSCLAQGDQRKVRNVFGAVQRFALDKSLDLQLR